MVFTQKAAQESKSMQPKKEITTPYKNLDATVSYIYHKLCDQNFVELTVITYVLKYSHTTIWTLPFSLSVMFQSHSPKNNILTTHKKKIMLSKINQIKDSPLCDFIYATFKNRWNEHIIIEIRAMAASGGVGIHWWETIFYLDWHIGYKGT